MSDLSTLLHLGDVRLTVPVAVAISAALLAWRAWRMAFWWSLLFALGLGLVAASKIAFMGWGTGWSALCYKALSGHATGATAIFPVLFYLMLQQRRAIVRRIGIAAGIGLGLAVGVLLVLAREHSATEAVAGFLMGSLVSLGAIRMGAPLPAPRPLPVLASFAVAFVATAWLMQSAHVGYWMVRLARLLSGNDTLYRLTFN